MNKQQLIDLLNPFPKKVDLQAQIISEKDCGKYIRQKVGFYSEEDDIISAYVLIPKGISGKISAVYCHHQHASDRDIGKKEIVGIQGDPDMALGKELVEKGYIVLAPDAIAFEERQNSIGGGEGHYFDLASRITKGENLLSKCVHDIQVGIDYLVSRTDVDIENIGFIGHSYGGRMALIMPTFDERIKASVSNCGCINYKDSIEKNIGVQLEFCVPGITTIGDIEDIIKLSSSSHLFISGTRDDKYSMGIDSLKEKLQPSFLERDLQVDIYDGGHVFTSEMRDNAYTFLDTYLK